MTLRVLNFNPVYYMEGDEEIVDFLVDCYLDDDTSDERVYKRAMEFVLEAKGSAGLVHIHRAYKVLMGKQSRNPNWRQDESMIVRAA